MHPFYEVIADRAPASPYEYVLEGVIPWRDAQEREMTRNIFHGPLFTIIPVECTAFMAYVHLIGGLSMLQAWGDFL